MIPFNVPPKTGLELKYIEQAIASDKLCGDGYFSKKCEKWFEDSFNTTKALLTPSCTASLELAAILIDIQPGDEVIMPSYTFVSTANAFVLRGAKIIFVDVRPDTMNMDETLIAAKFDGKEPKKFVPHFTFPFQDTKIHVKFRPYLTETLEKLSQLYEIVVWTAGV